MSIQLIDAARNGNLQEIKHLIAHGANVNIRTVLGSTALHWAARKGHAAIVEYLVSHGADVNASNEYSETALHWSAWNGHVGIIKLLVSQGAIVNAHNENGNTALHLAAREGHASAVEYLVKNGADTNIRNEDGNTPLYWAVMDGNATIIKIIEGANRKSSSENTLDRRGAILALLDEDCSLRKRLGIRSDLSPGANYDVERLLQYTLSKRSPTDPTLRADVEAGIAFHIETAKFVEDKNVGMCR